MQQQMQPNLKTQPSRSPEIKSSMTQLPPTDSLKILFSKVVMLMRHLTNLLHKTSEALTGKQELALLARHQPQTRLSLQTSPTQLEVRFPSIAFSLWKNPISNLARLRLPLHRNHFPTSRSKPPTWRIKHQSTTQQTTTPTAYDTKAQPWGTQRKIQTDS